MKKAKVSATPAPTEAIEPSNPEEVSTIQTAKKPSQSIRILFQGTCTKLLTENKEELSQDDWLQVRSALLLAAGINSMISLALVTAGKGSRKAMTGDLKADLAFGLDEVASRDKGSSTINDFTSTAAANNGGQFQAKE